MAAKRKSASFLVSFFAIWALTRSFSLSFAPRCCCCVTLSAKICSRLVSTYRGVKKERYEELGLTATFQLCGGPPGPGSQLCECLSFLLILEFIVSEEGEYRDLDRPGKARTGTSQEFWDDLSPQRLDQRGDR